MGVETEPLERMGLELRQQRPPRRLELEGPPVRRRDPGVEPQLLHERRDILETRRRDDLARAQHRELVGQRLACVAAEIFGGRELAGGHIEQRDAVPWSWVR